MWIYTQNVYGITITLHSCFTFWEQYWLKALLGLLTCSYPTNINYGLSFLATKIWGCEHKRVMLKSLLRLKTMVKTTLFHLASALAQTGWEVSEEMLRFCNNPCLPVREKQLVCNWQVLICGPNKVYLKLKHAHNTSPHTHSTTLPVLVLNSCLQWCL